MTNPLSSATAKLRWANQHAARLKNEITAFLDKNPYSVVQEINADGTQYLYSVRIDTEPPLEDWSLMLGDALSNFRSALDHSIYTLASIKSRQDPPPDADKLSFPIAEPNQLSKHLWRLGILENDSAFVAEIDLLQPYNRRNKFTHPMLALLQQLNNRDKHKLLTVTSVGMEAHDLSIQTLPLGLVPQAEMFITDNVVSGTKLLRLTYLRPPERVDVDSTLRIEPSVHHTPDHEDSRYTSLRWILSEMTSEISYCIDRLTSHADALNR